MERFSVDWQSQSICKSEDAAYGKMRQITRPGVISQSEDKLYTPDIEIAKHPWNFRIQELPGSTDRELLF